jgi:hypothetical protein
MVKRQLCVVACVAACIACTRDTSPLDVVGAPSRTINVNVAEEFRIRLQTIGPGEYRSPPEVSGTAIRFVDVTHPTWNVPAGQTQLFGFQAVTRGQAIVRFRHSGQSPELVDTVVVR